MVMCSQCHKRMAVLFITKIENNETKNEGLCLKCAKEMGIPQVTEMIKGMGMTDEDLDQFADEFDQMSEQLGFSNEELDSHSAPSLPAFFNKLMGNPSPDGEGSSEEERSGKDKKKEKKHGKTAESDKA